MICPNFNNPQVREDFYNLVNVVGEDFAYYLWNKNSGLPLHLSPSDNVQEGSIANPLYNALEEKFQGDKTKAILGTALVYSSAFRKKFVGFDRISTDQQVERITSYLNNLDISLENAVKNYARRANKINRTFKRAHSSTEQVVTREDLRKNPNSTVNQTEDLTAVDRSGAYEFLRTNNLLSQISLKNAQRVVNSGVFAQWTKDGIALYKGSDYTDLYHEAWHAFTQWFLTPLEKTMLYNTIRNREGKIKLGNLEIPHYALTQRQAEEILAEEFRAFAIAKNREQKTQEAEPRVTGFFERIYNFLKWLFTGVDPNTTKPVSTFDLTNVNSLFEALYEGNVDLTRANEKNIVEESLNRSSSFTIPVSTDEGMIDFTVDPSSGAEIISFLNYSIYKQLRDRKLGISALLNPENKKELITELYRNTKAELNTILDKLEEQMEEANNLGKDSLFDLLEDQYNSIIPFINEDEAWEKVIEMHQMTSQGDIFSVEIDSFKEEDVLDSQEDNNNITEETRNSVEYGDKSGVNPLEFYDPYVVELIKSIPDVVMYNGKETISTGRNLGLPKGGDFQYNKNLLQKILSGSRSYADMISRIERELEYNPQLKYLLELLPDPNKESLSLQEITVQNQFVQALSMPSIEPYSVKATSNTTLVENEDGVLDTEERILFSTFYISTLTQDALLEYLDNEFQTSGISALKSELDPIQTKERKFVNRPLSNLEFATFSTEGVIGAYQITDTTDDKTLFAFMNDAFGVDLYQGQNPDLIFDKRGMLNSNSRYNNSDKAALRNVIKAAYNKIYLYQAIKTLPNKISKQLKNHVNTNIETPAKTFIQDIKKPLIKELEALTKKFQGEYILPENRNKQPQLPPTTDKSYTAAEKTLLFEILDHYHNNIKRNNNLRNERQILFRSIENYYNRVVKSASYLNENDDLEWAIREWQHVVTQSQSLNTIGNLYELSGHLNPTTNNFIANSRLIERAFNLGTGERMVNMDGVEVLFDLINISGYKAQTEGDKTIDLNPDDKLIQDFTSFIKDGVVENLRYGAKSTSLGLRTNGSRRDRLFYDINNFSLSQDTNTVILDGAVVATFRNYLKYELSRMFDDRAESNPKEKRGFDLVILKDILGNKTDAFKKLIKESTEDKETTVNKALSLVSFSELTLEVNKYFNKEIELYIADLVDAFGIDREELPKKIKEAYGVDFPLEIIVADYVTHYYTQQIEFLHLFVGDPTNFQIKNENWRELFKRLGASISPGKQPAISDQVLRSWNNSTNGVLNRKLETLYRGNNTRGYDRTFNYVQFKDVTSYTADQHNLYKDTLIENYAEWLRSVDTNKTKQPIEQYRLQAAQALEKTIDGAEGQKKEADGQAYVTLDFVRFYLNSVGEWTPKQEKAYQHEALVAEKMMEYATNPTEELLSEIQNLKEQSNAGILVSLKLGYWGSPTNDPKYITLGKYSVAPLIPSVVFGNDLEDLMVKMLSTGTDFTTFDSGNKMALPVESIDFYKKVGEGKNERLVVNDIPESNIVNFPIEGLRRQQYIAPKFKNKATLSTQLVKLVFSNFYENGELTQAVRNVPGLAEKITNMQNSFIRNLEIIVETEKAKILNAIGANLDGDRVESIDAQLFKEWIEKEFDKKDIPQSVYDYLIVENNRFKFSLDVSPQRALFESVLSSAITKRVVRPKMFGEALVQLSSLGHNKKNTRYTNPTKEQVEKYGNSGLRDYGRIVNGIHQPADIKVAFNPKKHASLLKLTYQGAEIQTLDVLNQALMDDAWVEKHSKKITMVGVRIPVQGLNSMEHFRIREFLPETAGPVIIVPPSLVTKSGSDFDIDKLFMYEPQLDEFGDLIKTPQIIKNNPKDVYKTIQARNKLINTIKDLNKTLENKRQEFIATNGTNSTQAKVYDSLIANNGMLIRPLKNRKKALEDTEENELLEKISAQSITMEKFLEDQQANPLIQSLLSKLKKANTSMKAYRGISFSSIKAGSSNDLINTISQVLGEPAVMTEFLKPNESPILKTLAEEYRLKYRGDTDLITATSVFSPRTSVKIFRENATGKKALGIDAKTNALHKLYQQVGLKYMGYDKFFYLLKSNRDSNGNIILGGLYDANNEHLISDIINEFINGHVDIEKEEWINYFNADKTRTSVILQMVLSGTPIKDAILIANQPIVQHYIKNSRLSETAKLFGAKPKGIKYYIKTILNVTNQKDLFVYTDKGIDYEATIINMLGRDIFSTPISNLSEENYPPYTKNSGDYFETMLKSRSVIDLSAQLAFLTQYYAASNMNSNLLELTSVIDFNTASYQNLNDFHQLDNVIENAKDHFNEEAIDKILNNSVLSPFNINSQAQQIGNQIFDVMGSSLYQKMLTVHRLLRGTYWTAPERTKKINELNNAIVHALIQKYAELNGLDYYAVYGPKSGYLTKGAVGNLFSRYTELFGKDSKIADENLRNFIRRNLFLKNFRKKDVENTNKFYIATLTNEKDNNFVNSMQQSFIEGLNYDKSTPEVNALVRQFFDDVANATIVGQGFGIRYKSIQPYLPAMSLESSVRASVELKRIRKELLEKNDNEPFLIDFVQFLQEVEKIYSRNAFSPAKKSMNYWKFFPDYVNSIITKGTRISDKTTGLGAALALNTEASKKDKRLSISYPVTFRGKEYADAKAAYTAFSQTYGLMSGTNKQNEEAQVKLLREILAERFKQNLSLFGAVHDVGGAEFLYKSSYKEGASFLNTSATQAGGYVEALYEAYRDVSDEMTSRWMDVLEAQKLKNEKVENPDSNVAEVSENSERLVEPKTLDPTEDLSIDSDDLFAQAKNLAMSPKNPTLNNPPNNLDEKDIDVDVPKNLKNEEVLTMTLPNGSVLQYSEITPERMLQEYPTLNSGQINFVVQKTKEKFRTTYPGVDFESNC